LNFLLSKVDIPCLETNNLSLVHTIFDTPNLRKTKAAICWSAGIYEWQLRKDGFIVVALLIVHTSVTNYGGV